MQPKSKTALKLAGTMADTICERRALKLTEPRRNVLVQLLAQAAPMKAYDIVETMGDVKPMTVYRALDFLAQNGLAHRIESLNAYIACAESHCAHADSQYMVCDSCGKVEELHNHDIDKFIAGAIKKTGFTLSHKKMELHGTCGQCA
jgi:Fur family zinc uptake transcriptional regulator